MLSQDPRDDRCINIAVYSKTNSLDFTISHFNTDALSTHDVLLQLQRVKVDAVSRLNLEQRFAGQLLKSDMNKFKLVANAQSWLQFPAKFPLEVDNEGGMVGYGGDIHVDPALYTKFGEVTSTVLHPLVKIPSFKHITYENLIDAFKFHDGDLFGYVNAVERRATRVLLKLHEAMWPEVNGVRVDLHFQVNLGVPPGVRRGEPCVLTVRPSVDLGDDITSLNFEPVYALFARWSSILFRAGFVAC